VTVNVTTVLTIFTKSKYCPLLEPVLRRFTQTRRYFMGGKMLNKIADHHDEFCYWLKLLISVTPCIVQSDKFEFLSEERGKKNI
jgi:hypothetical protein